MCPCLLHFCRWWTKSGLSCLMSSSRYRVHNFSWNKCFDDYDNLYLTLAHWPSWRAGLSLSKVHDFLGVGMDQNGPGHSCGGSVLAAPWQVASLSAVMLLLDKVIPTQTSLSIIFTSLSFSLPRSEGDQVRVVGGGGDGHWARAPDVGVTQLVSKLLQLVSVKVVIIPEHVVVARARCALDTWEQSQCQMLSKLNICSNIQ